MKRTMIFAAALSVVLSSCGRLPDSAVLESVEPSVVNELPSSYYKLVAPEGDNDRTLFTVTWTETMFRSVEGKYIPVAPVSYLLEADRPENDFSNPVTVASTTELGVNVKTREFNFNLLDSLRLSAGKEGRVSMRVVAEYGQNSTTKVPSSNSLNITVVPFQDRDPMQLLYVSRNGESVQKALPMFKTSSDRTNNTYTLTAYFPAGCSFSILPSDHNVSGMAYFKKTEGVMELSASGVPFTNQTAGYKNFSVNVRNLTYTFEDVTAPAKTWRVMGFIGNFCNWENEPQMSLIASDNPHIWKLEYTLPELAAGEVHSVKFRAENSWGSRWAAIDADSVPYGRMIYLEGSESDPNVVLRSGGTYQVYFNDLTAMYIIKQK